MPNCTFVPDFEILEEAAVARKEGNFDHVCFKLFSKAWLYRIDTEKKIIWAPKEINGELLKRGYKSEKQKRQALFYVLRVYEDEIKEPTLRRCAIALASRLSISLDDKIYFVTDDLELITELKSRRKIGFEVITTEEAINIITKLPIK